MHSAEFIGRSSVNFCAKIYGVEFEAMVSHLDRTPLMCNGGRIVSQTFMHLLLCSSFNCVLFIFVYLTFYNLLKYV